MEIDWAPIKVPNSVIVCFILMTDHKGELPFWVLDHIACGNNMTAMELERKILNTGLFAKLMNSIYPIYSEIYALNDNDKFGYISTNRSYFEMWSLKNNKSPMYFSIVFDVERNIFNDDIFEKIRKK